MLVLQLFSVTQNGILFNYIMNNKIDPVKLELLRIARCLTANQYDNSKVEDIISKAQMMFDFLCNDVSEKSINDSMSTYSEILKKLEKMNADSK